LKTGVLAEPILVGRERELEELMNKLDLAIEGKGTTVFVTGEAGSGKTRLTHEFLKGAKEKGVSIMAGWCLSEAESPYFPFVEAFNSYFSSLADEEQPEAGPQVEVQFSLGVMPPVRIADRGITAWLTGTKPQEKNAKTEIVSPQVWKDQVFAGVARTLHEISVQLPIVLFIEDIHWADSASLALIHYVARVINGSEKILVVATFRSEELTADAEGHPHPLAETLKMMNREDLFTEIELTSLNQADVANIAKNMIGESLQLKLTEKLTAESNGNPLFVVESLRMLHEQGSFVQKSGVWHLAVDELGIPSKIRDIILCRLACLKYSQRRVLDAASVIGEEFNV
jgi:predicted ATPase